VSSLFVVAKGISLQPHSPRSMQDVLEIASAVRPLRFRHHLCSTGDHYNDAPPIEEQSVGRGDLVFRGRSRTSNNIRRFCHCQCAHSVSRRW
jgi:hypothetical protein